MKLQKVTKKTYDKWRNESTHDHIYPYFWLSGSLPDEHNRACVGKKSSPTKRESMKSTMP